MKSMPVDHEPFSNLTKELQNETSRPIKTPTMSMKLKIPYEKSIDLIRPKQMTDLNVTSLSLCLTPDLRTRDTTLRRMPEQVGHYPEHEGSQGDQIQ